jgi:hypothetical protein
MSSKTKLRMSAYYYDFAETGIPEIDKILSAVACAGKAYHGTENWNDDCEPYPGHTGATPIDWIWNAAQEAAAAWRARAQVETSGNCGPNTPWDRLCGEPSCGYCGLRRTPDLPAFIRRDVERAIEDALHPRGMSTHDGKARIGVDRLQYLMRMIDGTQDGTPAHRKWPGEPPHCPSCSCGAPAETAEEPTTCDTKCFGWPRCECGRRMP